MNSRLILYFYYVLGCIALDKMNGKPNAQEQDPILNKIRHREKILWSLFGSGHIDERCYVRSMSKLAEARIMCMVQ